MHLWHVTLNIHLPYRYGEIDDLEMENNDIYVMYRIYTYWNRLRLRYYHHPGLDLNK